MYLRSISIRSGSGWPWSIPSISGLETLDFPSPVTLLCGENGSGKSTLLEALAIRLRMSAIGRTDAHRDDSLSHLRPFASSISTVFSSKPRSSFFLRSEDFFNFVRKLCEQRQELEAELRRTEKEYAARSVFAQNQARMAFAGELGAMRNAYGEDLLSEASHGESFLRLFGERLHPGGLYLLDEPEAPLSPLRQMGLLSLIMELSNAKNGCQFIIATHSPILLACPDSCIYSFDTQPLSKAAYDELPAVSLLKSFLALPQRYIKNL